MSLAGYPRVELPDGFHTSTSWERAGDEEAVVDPINRAEFFVRVGDGDRHRVAFGLRDGEPVGECDCRGWTHHQWCAHVAHLYRRYVREDIVVSDLDADPNDELAALWRRYRRAGEDV
jgi:hypothetical protein